MNYYKYYAESIRRGSLALAEADGPLLCPRDTSFFDGRCYLYFGTPPVVLHLLTDVVSDRVWTILASTLAVLFLNLFFLRVAARVFPEEKPGSLRALPGLIFLTFGTGLLTTAVCGWVYGEAMSFSYAFGFAAVYLLVPVLFRETTKLRRFALIGTLLGCASLCRPVWFFVSLFFCGWFMVSGFREKGKLAALLAPQVVMGVFQGWLNWIRFGNPLEFGLRYTNANLHHNTTEKILSLEYLFKNFATYFFAGLPPRVVYDTQKEAMYLKFSKLTLWFTVNRLSLAEVPLGLFLIMPVLLVSLPKVVRLEKRARKKLLLLAGAFLPPALLVYMSPGQSWRYQIEAWLWVLVVLLTVLMTDQATQKRWERGFLWISTLISLVASGLAMRVIIQSRFEQL